MSWKFYVSNYDPKITFRAHVVGDRSSQVVWVPLLNYARFIDDPKLAKHIVPLSQYYDDLATGHASRRSRTSRPRVRASIRPGSVQSGMRFVRTVINNLMASSSWKSSAFLLSYDDWGGWYDHVRPPQIDGFGYGFRVPAILVSPYARHGYVDHTTLDFTSGLKFIEENWGVAPLTRRDRGGDEHRRGVRFRPIAATRTNHPCDAEGGGRRSSRSARSSTPLTPSVRCWSCCSCSLPSIGRGGCARHAYAERCPERSTREPVRTRADRHGRGDARIRVWHVARSRAPVGAA